LPTITGKTFIQLTTGNDNQHVKQSSFNWIQLERAHTLRVINQLLPEMVDLSGWHYAPRQEVSEVVLFWVKPVQSSDEDATLGLAKTNDGAAVSGR